MTWLGESPQSGIVTYTEDGSPGVIHKGSDGQVLSIIDGEFQFVDQSVGPSGQHKILSYTHSDTISEEIENGDLLYASGSYWRKLPIGTEGQVVSSINGKPTWYTNTFDEVNESGTAITDGFHTYSSVTAYTTSDVYETLEPSLVLPGSGTFSVVFSASIESSAKNVSAYIAAFVNGIQTNGTERHSDFASALSTNVLATNGIVEVPTSGIVEIRWKRVGGTPSTMLTAHERDLTLIRIRRLLSD